MDDRIKEFCERLEFERKWLTSAGHLSSDIDIAFSAIRSKFLELFDKQEEPTLKDCEDFFAEAREYAESEEV